VKPLAHHGPRAERIAIPGPAGDLQALIEIPRAEASGPDAASLRSLSASGEGVRHFAVVCHPHPLYGGTLDNKVVYTLARACEELGAPAIRFNFRGVGSSAGQYDHGGGETDDALAVISYGRQRWPGAQLWLGGFSFGGAVAIRAAERAHPNRLIAAAPAVTRVPVEESVQPTCPWLIVQGDADDVVEPGTVLDWASRRSPAPNVVVLPGAGHYFHGRLNELRDAVLAFLRT
jgi:uncharacterized protein